MEQGRSVRDHFTYVLKDADILIFFYLVIEVIMNISWGVLRLLDGRLREAQESTPPGEGILVSSTGSSDKMMLSVIFLLALILLLLDVWHVLDHWMDAKKEEWSVRRFFGASLPALWARISGRFLCLMALVFAAAEGMTWLVMKGLARLYIHLSCPLSERLVLFGLLCLMGNALNGVWVGRKGGAW